MGSQSEEVNAKPPATLKDWFKAFGEDVLGTIPFGATSRTVAAHLIGKVPGHKLADGTWVGDTGPMAERRMTLEQAKKAYRDGAGVGLLGRNYPALDIDVDDEDLAAEIEKHAFKTLGPAPVRTRVGSARRLLLYAGTGLRKQRVEFRHPSMPAGAKPWAVELLATGQYFNVAGVHPSGQPYEWRGEHPCVLGPYGLSEIGEEAVKACF
jgi:hypothetical protein